MEMPLYPTWSEIAVRLILTIIAGAALGLNRSAHGHVAGFRTTILVGLAAAVAMIQANILLPISGKTAASFGVMDLMRLPLGILTGVGFIGGGCILRRGELVTGVTTAAALWIITVIGLCFGGGQLILGVVTTALSVITLWVLKWIDNIIPRDHQAWVVIATSETLGTSNLNAHLEPWGYHAYFQLQRNTPDVKHVEFRICWKKSEQSFLPVDLLKLLEKNYKVESFGLTSKN